MSYAQIDRTRRQNSALQKAEAEGLVADSMKIRLDLIDRLKRGDLDVDEVRVELKKIKRNAKKNGLKTREQIYRETR